MRDYSGRTADYYFLAKEQKQGQIVTMRKIKGRKKQSDKEGFLRIGSLNVRVKKTTEAFSNFLGVGSGASVTPLDSVDEKLLKGWGSVDNVNKEGTLKNYGTKKKSKKSFDSGGSSTSTPGTPKTPIKMFNSMHCNDSDSDTAAGFDSNWKN
ncbi:unnamed protein product [Psylliodes chrysocephalus]|uniref:Uncharacterized protein n=1 Tax=Psylliodes chrysocephalus TaxID=3402493 RepID=A0A9P0D360_9CUCU|nr:unnamed protein product [Psylliodes chrysocephala]